MKNITPLIEFIKEEFGIDIDVELCKRLGLSNGYFERYEQAIIKRLLAD